MSARHNIVSDPCQGACRQGRPEKSISQSPKRADSPECGCESAFISFIGGNVVKSSGKMRFPCPPARADPRPEHIVSPMVSSQSQTRMRLDNTLTSLRVPERQTVCVCTPHGDQGVGCRGNGGSQGTCRGLNEGTRSREIPLFLQRINGEETSGRGAKGRVSLFWRALASIVSANSSAQVRQEYGDTMKLG
jgi:hypothetical protein